MKLCWFRHHVTRKRLGRRRDGSSREQEDNMGDVTWYPVKECVYTMKCTTTLGAQITNTCS